MISGQTALISVLDPTIFPLLLQCVKSLEEGRVLTVTPEYTNVSLLSSGVPMGPICHFNPQYLAIMPFIKMCMYISFMMVAGIVLE